MELSELTHDTFAPRVGDSFRDPEGDLTLELLTVDDLSEMARNVPAGQRAPFSLVFRAPAEPLVPQGIRTLVHDDLGELTIFLVPIAQEPDGLRYQAVFT
jgi:hypothetical protein